MNKTIVDLVRKNKKRFLRKVTIRYSDDENTIEDFVATLREFGLYAYDDPADCGSDRNILISNRILTYGWYIKWYEKTNKGNSWARRNFEDHNPKEELEPA